MKSEDQKNLNNLYLRYEKYDKNGTKYSYDIYFTTLNGGRQMKAKRETGADNFRSHMEELIESFSDVSSITVSDYNGKSPKAAVLNPPVELHLIDVKSVQATPKVLVRDHETPAPAENRPANDLIQGLGALFVGTEYEGLGALAPFIKGIDDKHTISRLNEKNDAQTREIDELRRKNEQLEQKCDTLQKQYDDLQDEADDMEDELMQFHQRDRKQDKWIGMLGVAGASIAKNFLKQNPAILSGIIPADQLAGLLSDDEPTPPAAEKENTLTEEEQSRFDDATTIFEWLQTLDAAVFEKVVQIIAIIRQNTNIAAHVLNFLNGKHQVQTT